MEGGSVMVTLEASGTIAPGTQVVVSLSTMDGTAGERYLSPSVGLVRHVVVTL